MALAERRRLRARHHQAAVDVPDVNCHWYITAPDNTFGEGFDWATAPWFDVNGLSDVAELTDTLASLQH